MVEWQGCVGFNNGGPTIAVEDCVDEADDDDDVTGLMKDTD